MLSCFTNVILNRYAAIEATDTIQKAYRIGQEILQRIMKEQDSLFLTDPFVFND
jgi:hypothetical protein